MRRRILSVSYDPPLLRTRQMMLESQGHEVISCATIDESLRHCSNSNFDLFILGHSIPSLDQHQLIESFRRYNSAPIISLMRSAEAKTAGADYHIRPDPEPLLTLVAEILGDSTSKSESQDNTL
jgi:DNA-binding response OmpR family regulator